MWARGGPITLVLFRLFGSASLFPYTPAPSVPSQISPPPPLLTDFPSWLSPSLSISSSNPHLTSSSGESSKTAGCDLSISPSSLVVRFGDPVKANCSRQKAGFPALGWEVSVGSPETTLSEFLVWRVDRLTEWSIDPMCYVMSDVGGKCDVALSLTVYQPPTAVSITYVNHTGPLLEGGSYSLQCTVQDVAPLEKVVVIFYEGQTALSQIKFNDTRQKTPANKSITQSIVPCREDNGTEYWCEARLDLGPEGPQQPLVVTSQKLTLLVLSHPNSTKLQRTCGKCNGETSPENSGTINGYQTCFLLAALLSQMIIQQ
ncbi:intercellular adhesion molecule 3 [Oryzias melastigma]|uniref:Intercellular adhesion molecule 3-like n=1 Tax=Oryzias melastigma TaxID=30732 RepID=A0A3B3CGD6_ORYME|nr:intercellular adhesion molecule 3 [Oryzias melastigma]